MALTKLVMNPVKSSNLSAVGYDPESKTMRVEFNGGARHDYSGITPEQFTDFMSAESKGKHFHKNFRSRSSKPVRDTD
ncbi:KTSC domain-containing protein [Ferrovibrio terrae]|uniref:KTSC domain-containing protein n=1 Tax=Ferrovibrio terrae TaxID=2594003 RepID=UPI003137A344